MTDLAAGDIALIGYSADTGGVNPKGFSFVLLKGVDANTTINFTDNGWLAAGGFRSGEGTLTWTAGANGAAAGTVIDFTNQTGTFNLSTSGDSIIAYQGSAGAPNPLFALHIADGGTSFDATANTSNTSAVPTGLVAGQTALAFGADNGAYTGPTTGTASDLLHDIQDSKNWTTDDASSVPFANGFTVTGGGSPPPPPAPTVSVADVTQAEGNGDHTVAITVTRSDTSTAFSVDYATHDGTATTADHDYDASSGTLTFAAGGPATQTIDITVHGDTTVEPDEAFTLTLSNVTNTTGATTLGTDTSHVTLTNDDTVVSPPPPPVSGAVFINEFHYDNSGVDTGEFIEVAAPTGADLTGYKLELYNGHDGTLYNTKALSGVVGAGENGEGVVSFDYPSNGIQNGGTDAAPEGDGIALVDPNGHVVEFVSYEGVFTAKGGDADGMTSVDVGVHEDGSANGTAIARTGAGAEAGDFNWTLTGANGATPGQVNTGEDFLAPSPRVHISDASVTEGDSGTTTMTFTVTRTGTSDPFSVDYATADGTATHGSDYVATSGTLNFAAGQTTQTISVTVNGDTDVEGDETLNVNLSNATGGVAIVDGQGTGTILNDDVGHVHTYEIQGASQTSPLDGQHVITEGVVTAVDTTGSKGFWIQDAVGDHNDATSDAVFVFTGTTPTVTVGHLVQVEGDVDEFQGSDPNNLPITEVVSSAAQITDEGVGPTIAPTIIGEGGRDAPHTIDSDNFHTFNPDHDAVDFYESMEGMLVTVKNAQVTTATFSGETFVAPDDAATAVDMNDRGGVTISPDSMTPEALEVFQDSGVSNVTLNNVAGDHIGDVTGVVSYFGGNYELLPTSVSNPVAAGTVTRETTALTGDASHLTVGEYNLDNLSADADPARFTALASDIAHNLGGPDIIGLEEVGDNAAAVAAGGTDFTGTATLQHLVDDIAAAGGPHYAFAEIAPTANGTNGGEANVNIRQAFLYDPTKVSLVDGSLRQISDDDPTNGDAYANSRKPLVGDFMFNGEKVTVVDLHDYSRGGSDENFGVDQPPVISGDQRRTDQTSPVEHFVQQQEANDPNAHIVVTGDFNGYQFETAQSQLTTGGILTNLDTQLDPTDRYSYNFDGSDEQLDQMYASPSLAGGSQFDIVHLNSGQSDASRDTDHDPTLGRFLINTAPTAGADTASANDHQSVNIDVLANDTDPNPGDTKTLVSVSATTAGGHAAIQNGQVVYTADADAFDALAPGQHATDTFTYTMQDAAGATSTATVTVTVNGIAQGVTQTGTAGDDNMTGTLANESITAGAGNDTVDAGTGSDTVAGGAGNDLMMGGDGADNLSGGDGNDTLIGGAGNDTLAGSRGNDLFVFGQHFGHDVVTDYQAGDQFKFQGMGFGSMQDVVNHATEVLNGHATNVLITDDAGDTLQINNTTIATLNSHSGDFLFA